MTERAVVATMWNGVRVLAVLAPGAPDPAPGSLAALAARLTPENGGVAPTVRVLEQAAPLRAMLDGPAGTLPLRLL